MSNDTTKFEYALASYLNATSLNDLRKYGREIGVHEPTKLKKSVLIDNIVAVLSGKIAPVTSNRGAPVKDRDVNPRIIEEVERLQLLHLGDTTEEMLPQSMEDEEDDGLFFDLAESLQKKRSNPLKIQFEDGAKHSDEIETTNCKMVIGQLALLNDVYMLLPLDFRPNKNKIVVPADLVRKNDVREGDILACNVCKSNSAYVVIKVLSVNGYVMGSFKRERFEDQIVEYPKQPFVLHSNKKFKDLSAKYLSFLAPMFKGQRGVIYGPPKAGASTLLYKIATAAAALNDGVKVLVLLVDSSLEDIQYFRDSFAESDVVATSYEDQPERQVFVADYMLKRAKSWAEFGYDVLLIVDSFTALAKAYNDTAESEGGKTFPCGLESKTLFYLKKFIASARNFKLHGSLTIVGSATAQTGDPVDELICSEIVKLSGFQIRLNGEMAYRHQYPAIDPTHTYTQQTYAQLETFEALNKFLQTHDKQDFRLLMQSVSTYEEFLQKLKL